jgi:putative ABC transport system permease protein
MLQDLLVGARTLVKRPAYSLSIVLTLAIGIAATTLMFSLLDAVVLRPLPFEEPDRLVSLTGVAGPQRDPRGGSFPEIADWRSLNRTLQDVSIYDEISLNLRIGAEAVRVDAEMVSASYFGLLGRKAALGRTFLAEEDAVPDRHAVAVISDALWKSRFSAAPDVLQRPIHLNDRAFSIVGVMPPAFAGLSFDTDVWIPSMMVSTTSSPGVVSNRGTRWLGAIGRLRDGASVGGAQDDLNRVASALEQQHPQFNRERGVQVDRLQDALVGNTRPLVMALFIAVVLFLAVACANVASLQLARAAGRTRELAVRFALGARRWHVVRQLSIESIVLAVAAAGLGAVLAAWALGAVISGLPDGALPRHVRPALDMRAGAFALAIAVLAGALAAILPALAATERGLAAAIKEGARSAGPGLGSLRRPSIQQALVVTEIAVAMTLLAGAGLMLRSLDRQMRIPLGFNPAGVTVARVSLPATRYAPDARALFVERALESLRAVPHVQSAAVATSLPFTGNSSASIMLPDVAQDPDGALRYYRNYVTPDFFSTLRLAVRAGRTFTDRDRTGAPLVALINESGARRIWGRDDATGRRFRMGGPGAPLVEIVGVVADARFRNLTTDVSGAGTEPDLYFPFAQRTDRDLEIAVRTADGSAVSFMALQEAIAAIDAGVPAYAVQPLAAAVRQQTSTSRFGSTLLAIFSAGAMLLAAVGLYGLVAYVVGLSRREIAIRLALGADSRRVAALVVRNGMTLAATGILLGAAGAILAGRSLQAQLFSTDPVDPLTLGSVAMLLGVIALTACIIPTWRAIRVEPHRALRLE